MSNSTILPSSDRKQRYKLLLDEGLDLQSRIDQQLPSETLREVRDIIQTSDDIHKEGSMGERLENPAEVVLDAHVLKSVHELVSKVFLANSDFNDRMYHNSLNALVSQNETDNWQVITNIAIGCCRTSFTKSSMVGAIDVAPKERVVKERQQRRRNVIAAEKRPETVKQLKRDDRGAEKVNIILKQVSDIFRANNRQPIPYYKLIADPKSFMNTVENAFQMAFLARDGNIVIEKGQDGYPCVRIASKDEIEMHPETSQSICTLNMQFVQEIVEFYNIREPMLEVPDTEETPSTQNEVEESDSD